MSGAVLQLYEAAEHLRTKRADRPQLELGHDESSLDQDRWRELLECVRTVQAARQPKRVAADLGVSESRLSHCNGERNGNHHPMRDLAYYVRVAPNDDAVRLIASWRGLCVERIPAITAENALAGLIRAVGENLGPSMAKPLLAEAHRHALDEARK